MTSSPLTPKIVKIVRRTNHYLLKIEKYLKLQLTHLKVSSQWDMKVFCENKMKFQKINKLLCETQIFV